ncbi:hypothetical protein INR49_011137, partial [Caranx melampygus]
CEDLQHQPEPAVHSLEVRLDKDRGQAPAAGDAGLCLMVGGTYEVSQDPSLEFSMSLIEANEMYWCIMAGDERYCADEKEVYIREGSKNRPRAQSLTSCS